MIFTLHYIPKEHWSWGTSNQRVFTACGLTYERCFANSGGGRIFPDMVTCYVCKDSAVYLDELYEFEIGFESDPEAWKALYLQIRDS